MTKLGWLDQAQPVRLFSRWNFEKLNLLFDFRNDLMFI
jgi:hypothetical protein